jgi:hypothetical protein
VKEPLNIIGAKTDISVKAVPNPQNPGRSSKEAEVRGTFSWAF